MGKIITVVTQKGGVGKTSTALNCVYEFADIGCNTLAIDLDPNHNLSDPYIHPDNVKHSIMEVLLDKNFDPQKAIYKARIKGTGDIIANLDIMPSTLELGVVQDQIMSKAHRERLLFRQIEKIKDNYDYIVIDSPQSICTLSIIGLYAGELIIIPLEYASDSLKAIQNVFNVMREVKEDQDYDFKILCNNRDSRNSMVTKVDAQIEDFIKVGKVFKTVIRKDEQINKAKDEELPVKLFDPKTRAAEDYTILAKEIVNG